MNLAVGDEPDRERHHQVVVQHRLAHRIEDGVDIDFVLYHHRDAPRTIEVKIQGERVGAFDNFAQVGYGVDVVPYMQVYAAADADAPEESVEFDLYLISDEILG